MSVQISITGDKALDRKLRAMPGKVQRKLGSAALRAGARTVAKAVKTEYPVKSLRKTIGTKHKTGKYTLAGVTQGKGVRHANLYVRGTKPRYTKSGRYSGEMPENPTVDRGYAKSKDAADRKILESLKAGIEREAAK